MNLDNDIPIGTHCIITLETKGIIKNYNCIILYKEPSELNSQVPYYVFTTDIINEEEVKNTWDKYDPAIDSVSPYVEDTASKRHVRNTLNQTSDVKHIAWGGNHNIFLYSHTQSLDEIINQLQKEIIT